MRSHDFVDAARKLSSGVPRLLVVIVVFDMSVMLAFDVVIAFEVML